MDDELKSMLRTMQSAIVNVQTRVEQVDGGVQALDRKIDHAARAASEERRALHGETIRKFQLVIDEAERIGALAARDRRVSELEAEVTDLRSRLARVEKTLGTGGGGQ